MQDKLSIYFRDTSSNDAYAVNDAYSDAVTSDGFMNTALKCKPSALILAGRGRAKELLRVREALRKRTR